MSIKKRPPGLEQTGKDIISSVGIESPVAIHSTTAAAEMQEVILKLLRHGAENALTLNDLTNVTGWSGRAIRRVIHKARRDGVPILSDCEHGYFYPGSASEKRRFVRSMKHRAKEILAVAHAVESGVAT